MPTTLPAGQFQPKAKKSEKRILKLHADRSTGMAYLINKKTKDWKIEKDELLEKQKSLENKIKELNRKAAEQSKEVSDLNKERKLERLAARNDAKKVEEKTRNYDKVKKELDALKIEFASTPQGKINLDLSAIKTENKKLQSKYDEELVRSRKKVDDLLAIINSKDIEIEKAKKLAEDFKCKMVANSAESSKFEKQAKNFLTELEKSKTKLDKEITARTNLEKQHAKLKQDYEKQSKEKTELLNKLSVYQTDKETLAQQLLEQMNITEHSKQKHKQELEEIQEISRSHCAQSNKLTFDDNNYSISKESFHELIKTKISDYNYESKRLEVEFQDPVTQDFIEASGEFNFGLARSLAESLQKTLITMKLYSPDRCTFSQNGSILADLSFLIALVQGLDLPKHERIISGEDRVSNDSASFHNEGFERGVAIFD